MTRQARGRPRPPALERRQLTYDLVGATLDSRWTDPGTSKRFRTYEGTARIGQGDDFWAFASVAVMRWEVRTRSGFTVLIESGNKDDAPSVALGRFWLVARIGPVLIHEPVEVIGLVDEPERTGFAYGTLEGHPVRGKEAFLVERRPDGSVWLTIRSLTGPPRGFWKGAFPAVFLAQRIYRRRYLRALRVGG